MTNTTNDLKAQIKLAQAKATATIATKLENAKLTAKLKNLTNESLLNAQANLAIVTEASDTLKSLNDQCEQVVIGMPIRNAATREDRKWNPSRQYGYGNQIALVTGILSGIQYSANDHKVHMLALTGLNEDLVEQTLEAFGNTAYYSRNYHQVVASMPYNVAKVNEYLSIIESVLDITIDRTKITEEVFSTRFTIADNRAVQQMNEGEKALMLGEQLIEA